MEPIQQLHNHHFNCKATIQLRILKYSLNNLIKHIWTEINTNSSKYQLNTLFFFFLQRLKILNTVY